MLQNEKYNLYSYLLWKTFGTSVRVSFLTSAHKNEHTNLIVNERGILNKANASKPFVLVAERQKKREWQWVRESERDAEDEIGRDTKSDSNAENWWLPTNISTKAN